MYLPTRTTITLDNDYNLLAEEPSDWVKDKAVGHKFTIKGVMYIIKEIRPVGENVKVIVYRAP